MKIIVTCRYCKYKGLEEQMKFRYIQLTTGHIYATCIHCRKNMKPTYSILRRKV